MSPHAKTPAVLARRLPMVFYLLLAITPAARADAPRSVPAPADAPPVTPAPADARPVVPTPATAPRDVLTPSGGPRRPVDDSAVVADEAPEDGVPPPAAPPTPQEPPPSDASPRVLVSRGIGVPAHRIRVRIEAGTVWVTEEIRLRGERAGHRDGIVRIPAPSGAVAVEVSPAPARVEIDSGSFVIRPGPIRGAEERSITLTWLSSARRVAAFWRWSLVARPEHMRMAQPEMVVAGGHELEESAEGGWVVRSPLIDASSVLHARSASTRSTRVTVSLRSAPSQPRTVVVAIDASVSMDAARRTRALHALWSIADALAPGSTIQTMMYGATAEPIDAEARSPDAGDGRFAARRIASARLGGITRPAAALVLAREWLDRQRDAATSRRPLVVLLTDGGAYRGDGEIEAFRAAGAALRGVEIAVVDLARAPSDMPASELHQLTSDSGGAYVVAGHLEDEDVGPEARRVLAPLRVEPGTALIEGQRVPTPALRAGDTWSAQVERPLAAPRGRFDAGVIGRVVPSLRTALARLAGTSRGRTLNALPADERTTAPRVETATSIPQDILRDALRSSLIGPARRCFRADRAGRRRYAAHVRVDLLIAEGELQSVRVADISPAEPRGRNAGPSPRLLGCLAGAATAIDVPRANVWLEVRYPLVVRPESPDTVFPLAPSTSRALDRVLGAVEDDEPLRSAGPDATRSEIRATPGP